MKKKKRTIVQQYTPFERKKSKDIQDMIRAHEINPLNVISVGIGGARPYRTEDICNYFELTGKPFDVVSSCFTQKKKGDTYVRCKTI